MTPNRAEATCLIRASRRRPSASGAYQAGSSPPSPVFADPPARWMPIVSAWCASGDRAPTLIAETTKRRTIERASSTWSRAMGVAPTHPQLVARDARASGTTRDRRPVAGKRRVDAARVVGGGEGRDLGGDLRREQVRLAVRAEAGPARVGQLRLATGRGRGDRRRRGDAAELSSARSARVVRPGQAAADREAASHDGGVEVDDVDERAADVRRDRADAHPREGLAKPGLEGGDEVADGVRGGQRLGAARPGEFRRQFDRQPRMDGRGADREQHRHAVHVEDIRRVDDDVGPAAQARVGQRGMDGTGREDRRDREALERERRVGDDEDLDPGVRGADGAGRQDVEGGLQAARPAAADHVASSVRIRLPVSATAAVSPARSATIGRARRMVRGPRGGPPRRAGRRPSSTRRSMTMRSRSGSMAGFVTCAKAWRR